MTSPATVAVLKTVSIARVGRAKKGLQRRPEDRPDNELAWRMCLRSTNGFAMQSPKDTRSQAAYLRSKANPAQDKKTQLNSHYISRSEQQSKTKFCLQTWRLQRRKDEISTGTEPRSRVFRDRVDAQRLGAHVWWPQESKNNSQDDSRICCAKGYLDDVEAREISIGLHCPIWSRKEREAREEWVSVEIGTEDNFLWRVELSVVARKNIQNSSKKIRHEHMIEK
ncbi:hypothetical protein DFH08DRAFT_937983 [Mycena albidolilacea]|uniref:Uncharacterized protein n=1 Tax=Mycena albidolilacea TaxID=1033008 RepID=A0AAD6ZXG0_9AGAR|nr:hypothetical protein DFH08DRAFT_937983 [Mycena albidolilacea]